jgi:ferric-dicitrate binding protein FerR (iron transport regulator)
MNRETREPQDDAVSDDAALSAFLKSARRHPAPDTAARDRAFAAVRAEWRAGLEEHTGVGSATDAAAPRQAPARRRNFALAASVALLALTAGLVWRTQQIESPLFATAGVVRGTVTVQRGAWWGGDTALLESARLGIGESVATAAQSTALLRVSAGLSVRLAPDSRLRLDAPGRATLEAGTVFIDSDPALGETPLSLSTPYAEIRHLGTQYAVTLQSAGVEVAVREGAVAVTPPTGREARAVAGELLRLSGAAEPQRESVPAHGARWSWLASVPAPIDIDGAALGDFLRWYGRETGIEPRFAEPAMQARSARVLLRGSVAGLAPDEALDVIAASTGLELRRGPEGEVAIAFR